VTKSSAAHAGHNILITGIGGGVALMALTFAVAMKVNVYVTSSNADKLARAEKLGAKGGVNYKDAAWDKALRALLPKDRPYLDAIIDGAGADILVRGAKLLKQGGVIVSYGMTTGPAISWPMSAVLKNIEVRGSTMGSRKEFLDMVAFVREKEIKPVVDRVAKGALERLDVWEGLWLAMREGAQFGKIVFEIADEGEKEKEKEKDGSKL
jgi:D-arabinose 1-dehydrogenase-like Zn-dependent alcohol dehydrogenase